MLKLLNTKLLIAILAVLATIAAEEETITDAGMEATSAIRYASTPQARKMRFRRDRPRES